MRTSLRLGAAAVAGVLAVGSLGAVTAIGENAVDPVRPRVGLTAGELAARADDVREEATRAAAIEFAGALQRDRIEDFALLVYFHQLEQAAAEAAAAEAAEAAEAAAAQAAASQATVTGGGGAGGHLASIRACESGGNYATNTGNGYYGAYQFTQETWNAVGGSGNPAAASPGEQDMRAQMLIERSGTSPWPNCG